VKFIIKCEHASKLIDLRPQQCNYDSKRSLIIIKAKCYIKLSNHQNAMLDYSITVHLLTGNMIENINTIINSVLHVPQNTVNLILLTVAVHVLHDTCRPLTWIRLSRDIDSITVLHQSHTRRSHWPQNIEHTQKCRQINNLSSSLPCHAAILSYEPT